MDHSNDCKSKWRCKTQWMAFAFALLSILAISCDDDEVVEKRSLAPSELRYASVTEVYEGKAMESARPVVFSTTKPTYEIAAGAAEENGVYVEDQFQIVDTIGIIKLDADNQLIAGKYYLDIKVSNASGETVFPKAFELTILPSAIEGLQYSPSTQVLVRGNAESKTSTPVFKGSKPVTFELTEESDFQIDTQTGEISLASESEIDAGNYKLSVKATNVTGEKTFNEVVTIKVETLAYDLIYTPNEYPDVQQGQGKESAVPTVKGSAPITYTLKDNKGNFSIDSETGVISLSEDHTLALGTYALTVVATNAHGSVEFANAASFEIVENRDVLPGDLQYATNTHTVIEGLAFETVQPTATGSTPMTFALVNDFGAFAIDANTGVISLAEGNTLAVGDYQLSVKATNVKGEVIFDNVLAVTVKAAVVEQIFEDGWDGLSAAMGEKRLGNMVELSALEDPVQASNSKWTRGWGNWTVLDESGASARGAVMIPQKTENDDWLIAESVDLTNHVKAKLNFSGYSKYGISSNSTLKLLVADDYSGSVDNATWVEVDFELLPTASPAQTREVDLSQFDGKKVTIALRHESFLSVGIALDKLTRTHFILHFEVKAIQK